LEEKEEEKEQGTLMGLWQSAGISTFFIFFSLFLGGGSRCLARTPELSEVTSIDSHQK
jgi:hypothetical protein